jgi:PhnB protein
MPIKPIRDGFHAITPYLFAQGASQLIEFISAAFGGEVTFRTARPDGAIVHAEMRIGDSMLMLAEPTGQFGPTPTSIYLLSVCARRRRSFCVPDHDLAFW